MQVVISVFPEVLSHQVSPQGKLRQRVGSLMLPDMLVRESQGMQYGEE